VAALGVALLIPARWLWQAREQAGSGRPASRPLAKTGKEPAGTAVSTAEPPGQSRSETTRFTVPRAGKDQSAHRGCHPVCLAVYRLRRVPPDYDYSASAVTPLGREAGAHDRSRERIRQAENVARSTAEKPRSGKWVLHEIGPYCAAAASPPNLPAKGPGDITRTAMNNVDRRRQ